MLGSPLWCCWWPHQLLQLNLGYLLTFAGGSGAVVGMHVCHQRCAD